MELYKGGCIPLAEFARQKPDRDILVRLIVKKHEDKSVYLSHRNSKTDFPVLTCGISLRDGQGLYGQSVPVRREQSVCVCQRLTGRKRAVKHWPENWLRSFRQKVICVREKNSEAIWQKF